MGDEAQKIDERDTLSTAAVVAELNRSVNEGSAKIERAKTEAEIKELGERRDALTLIIVRAEGSINAERRLRDLITASKAAVRQPERTQVDRQSSTEGPNV